MNAGYQRSTLDINRVNKVNEISVGLSVQSVQRQGPAFNAKQVALNAGTIDQVKEIKKISVEVSVRSVQRQAQAFNARQVALNAGSQGRNWLSPKILKNFQRAPFMNAESSVQR